MFSSAILKKRLYGWSTVFILLWLIKIQQVSIFSPVNADSIEARIGNRTLESRIKTDYRNNFKKCTKHKVPSSLIQFPILSYSKLGFQYLPRVHMIEGEPFECRSGMNTMENPPEVYSNTIVYRTTTIQEFSRQRDEVGMSRLGHVSTMLFDNGMLGVGTGNWTKYYNPDEYCIESVQGQGDNTVVELRVCPVLEHRVLEINKCCPFGSSLNFSEDILSDHDCIPNFHENSRISAMEKLFHPDILQEKDLSPVTMEMHSGLKLRYVQKFPGCPEGHEITVQVDDGCTEEFHPVTTGETVRLYIDWKLRSFPEDTQLCFDHRIKFQDGDDGLVEVQRVLLVCEEILESNDAFIKDYLIHMALMYTGASFYLLTSIIYIVTWRKQNLHGRTLCCCTTTLFFMQAVIGTVNLVGIFAPHGTFLCVFLSAANHYCVASSFTWLLIVNVNLWWTFRSVKADAEQNERLFMIYCAFGWGFPFLIILVSMTLDQVYYCKTAQVPTPEYGKNDYCFVSPYALGYYLYYLLSTYIILSFVFASATILSLYQFRTRNVGSGSKRSKRKDKQTLLLFLKLLLVMGLGWAIEVIAWAVTHVEDNYSDPIWVVADVYNVLSPLLIFFIFGCNATTLTYLEQLYPSVRGVTSRITQIKKKLGQGPTTFTSATDTTDCKPSKSNASVVGQEGSSAL